MDLNYTEQQEAIRRMARDFAQKELAPGAEERDRTGQVPYDLYHRLGELGITGMRFPEEYGGTNVDFLSWCLVLEEIGRVDMSLSWTLFVGVSGATHIVELGTEAQKAKWREEYILPVVNGEVISASAITEPNAGSDTAAVQTTAVLDGDEWVINGTKAFITNAGSEITAFVTVVALTDKKTREFSTILVPTHTPGYTIMPPYRKMGLRSSDTRELVFEDCRVPADHLVGERGTGRRHTVSVFFPAARICLASTALGLAEACLDDSLRYASGRVAFKRPISQFQHVQGMLVDMALDLELSRLLRDKAAWLVDEGRPMMKEAAMVKYFCCETAKKAADFAVQIHGALGYMDECAVSRYYRDVRAATIADGTTEIQKWIIARELGC